MRRLFIVMFVAACPALLPGLRAQHGHGAPTVGPHTVVVDAVTAPRTASVPPDAVLAGRMREWMHAAPRVLPPPQTTALPDTLVSTQADPVTPAERVEWGRVSLCETGGNWHMVGPRFSGGLGMLNSTWRAFGGLEFAPNAGVATEDQQIEVAMRVQSDPPDHYRCTAW